MITEREVQLELKTPKPLYNGKEPSRATTEGGFGLEPFIEATSPSSPTCAAHGPSVPPDTATPNKRLRASFYLAPTEWLSNHYRRLQNLSITLS